MNEALVVIPSRYGSTRFPAKVLAKLDGRSIVEWCWRAAKAAKVGPVLIATEHEKVAEHVRSFGGEVVLTSDKCVSGTDRVFEAARKFKVKTRFILNVQGDQPLIEPNTIRKVAQLLAKNSNADISTAVMPLSDPERIVNPNVVKAVLTAKGRALYFSRAAIPFERTGGVSARYWEHLGIYGFRRPALERFVSLKPSPLERNEMLEQLRALEAGMTIYAAVVSDHPVAIDTPEDLSRAEQLLRSIS